MKRPLSTVLIVTALALAVLVITGALTRRGFGGERMLCHLEPADDGWHYRTKIEPWPAARCYYQGARMKSRRLLYWAESPKIPPPMVQQGEFELRWKGETR